MTDNQIKGRVRPVVVHEAEEVIENSQYTALFRLVVASTIILALLMMLGTVILITQRARLEEKIDHLQHQVEQCEGKK